MKDPGLSIREIDDLLQALHRRLRADSANLVLAEPATLLLESCRRRQTPFYRDHLMEYSGIIVDTIISGAYRTFGYDALSCLPPLAGDIFSDSSHRMPGSVSRQLAEIESSLDAIRDIVEGGEGPGRADPGGNRGKKGPRNVVSRSSCIPLVSIYGRAGSSFTTGRIAEPAVRLNITGERSLHRRFDPVVTFDHIFSGPNDPFEKQVHAAVEAAERHASGKLGMGWIYRFPREYSVSIPLLAALPDKAAGRLVGGSAGLALTAAIVSAISNLGMNRVSFEIRDGTAFTGSVDPGGNVEPVEDAFIPEKVRAVFFSTCKRIAVPAGNAATAEKARGELQREHPRRRLEIVPVSDVEEAAGSRSIFTRHEIPARRTLGQRIYHWRKHLVAGGSAAAAIFLGITMVTYLYGGAATEVSFTERQIYIKNEKGTVIGRKKVGFNILRTMNHAKRYLIDDLDGDGDEEVFVALSVIAQNEPGKSNRLHFYRFDDRGKEEDEVIYSEEEILGEEIDLAGIKKPILMPEFNPADLDGDGKLEIYILTHHALRAPSSIIRVIPASMEIESFFHRGGALRMAIGDCDSDGRKEIVFGGFSPAIDRALIFVLDHRFIRGSSPGGYCYSAEGNCLDVAKYCIRLPDCSLYEYFKLETWKLNPDVKEGRHGIVLSVKSSGPDARFTFAPSLDCISVNMEDVLNELLTRKDETFKIHADGIVDIERRLRKGVRYWNGSEWVAEPVMNRSYIELLSKSERDSLYAVSAGKVPNDR